MAHYKKTVERPLFHITLLDSLLASLWRPLLVTPPCTYADGIIRSDHSISLRTKAGSIPEGAGPTILFCH